MSDANFHPEFRDKAIALIRDYAHCEASILLMNPSFIPDTEKSQLIEATIKLVCVLFHQAHLTRAGEPLSDEDEFSLFIAKSDNAKLLYDQDPYNQDKGIRAFEHKVDRIIEPLIPIIQREIRRPDSKSAGRSI